VYPGGVRALALVACLACAAPSSLAKAPAAPPVPAPPRPEDEARAVLTHFATSVRDGEWPRAFALLSSRWRARTNPEQLAADWRAAGPVGARALSRVEALLAVGAPLHAKGRFATLAVGEGRTASLVLEEGEWRVDALE